MWLRLTIVAGLVAAVSLTASADIQAANRNKQSHSRRLRQQKPGRIRPTTRAFAMQAGNVHRGDPWGATVRLLAEPTSAPRRDLMSVSMTEPGSDTGLEGRMHDSPIPLR